MGHSLPGAGHFGSNCKGLPADRVDEAYASGVEADSSVRVGTRSSVFEVALDRAAQVAELAAYLVVPAGEQFNLYKMIAVGAPKVFIVEFGELGSVSSGGDYIGFVLLFVADKPVFKMAFWSLWLRTAQRPVGLVRLRSAEGFAEPAECLGCLGENAHPAHRPVEAVGNSHENIAGL